MSRYYSATTCATCGRVTAPLDDTTHDCTPSVRIPSGLIDRLADDYQRWRNGDLNALVFPAIVAELLHAAGRGNDGAEP